MPKSLHKFLRKEIANLEQAGLFLSEPKVESAPGPKRKIGGREVVSLASSDYLGLATHPAVKEAARLAVERWGMGAAASRILAGTLPLHRELEQRLSAMFGTGDTIVYSSGYHANTGLFESLFGVQDFVFCDDLIHPGLADGIRLSKARALRYRNADVEDLEAKLKASRAARFRVVVTESVFPLDGQIADLAAITELAGRYDSLVVVNDAHGLGVIGPRGRGAAEIVALSDHLVTGTFNHALGSGAGGYISGKQEVIAWLRQKSRPYLISGALPPANVASALAALELLAPKKLEQLRNNIKLFRSGLTESTFEIMTGPKSVHPIVTVVVGNAVVAQKMVDMLSRDGIWVVGFCHPVVPEGKARVRAQISASHSEADLRRATTAFAKAGRELGLI